MSGNESMMVDDVTWMRGALVSGTGGVTDCGSVCHGASIGILDMSRMRLRSRSSEIERESLRGL